MSTAKAKSPKPGGCVTLTFLAHGSVCQCFCVRRDYLEISQYESQGHHAVCLALEASLHLLEFLLCKFIFFFWSIRSGCFISIFEAWSSTI